jgi:acyl-CoA thioester hydrolase
MAYPTPFVGRIQQVEDQWTDYNGHFNMAYYNVLFDRAGDEAFEAVGLGPDYVRERHGSHFTLESHNTYVRELHAHDSVRIETQFLDYDAKRVHYVQQMFHASEGWLSCVTEIIVMHVDMAAKKSAPFPADVLEKIKGMCEAHKALPVPPQVGHRIGIPRKG